MKGRIQFLAVLLLCLTVVRFAMADNSKMTHIVFRMADPQIQEGTFPAMPRELWRVGTRYVRMEEPPDPDRGIHGLIIVDEPHAFMINRYNNQGVHFVDPGPTFNVHVPIFPFSDSSDISKLEFGHEWEFFLQRNARSMPNVKAEGERYKSYMLEIDGAGLLLFTDETTGHPVQLSLRSGEATYVVHYETYQAGLEPDMNLFKVPAGVVITEAKQ